MFRPLMQTRPDFAFFLARLALGLSLLPHGLAKIGIKFDGNMDIGGGLDQTVKYFSENFGLLPGFTYAAIAVEVLGSLFLIFGILARPAAAAVAVTMAMAAWKTLQGLAVVDEQQMPVTLEHVKTWWYDNPGSYHILAVGVAIAIMIRGAGWLSLDRAMSKSVVD